MKKLLFPNGDIRTVYEFKDLTGDAREYALQEQSESLSYYEENGKDFYSEKETIESIEINGYLFDEEGEIINVTCHTGKNNEILKYTYGKYDIEIKVVDC